MLVYPVLVVALGALWPLDWTHITLDSLSPVTGHFHGTTWAMAEVTGEGDPEEVVVVECTTSDEVGKNKESQKGWKQKLKEWAIEYAILDSNGKFQWSWFVVFIALMIIFGLITGYLPLAMIMILFLFLGKKFYNFMKDNCCLGCGGGATKNMKGTNLD